MWLWKVLAGAGALLLAHHAVAGSFSVSPVRIFMTPKDRAIAVTITNESDTPVVLQAEVSAWTQKADGADELTPTEDLILSPPILKLGPKARQVVRLARLVPPDLERQITYRMILREVPEALGPKENMQVQIALALSMPVFITPPPAKRSMVCAAARAGANLDVTCANSGTAYAQVREILVKEGDTALGRFDGGAYILPGARKVFPVSLQPGAPAKPAAATVRQLAVSFDDGQVQTFDIPVD